MPVGGVLPRPSSRLPGVRPGLPRGADLSALRVGVTPGWGGEAPAEPGATPTGWGARLGGSLALPPTPAPARNALVPQRAGGQVPGVPPLRPLRPERLPTQLPPGLSHQPPAPATEGARAAPAGHTAP